MNLKAIQVVNNLQCSLHVTGNERPFGRLSQEVLGAGAKNGHGLDHRADGTDMQLVHNHTKFGDSSLIPLVVLPLKDL